MERCLALAALGAGRVAPNPMVGAVLVHGERIIGEGFHEYFGGPHAEVNCIASVAEPDRALIPESTLYVSLEPCSHFGKTPPCTGLVIEKKIPGVVIGCVDPFGDVNGKGIKKLKRADVNVIVGVLEKESRELNKRFFTFHREERPYVILKWAQSRDGMITGPGRKPVRISNEYTNRLVHRWRSEEASILVGTNTAMTDDPALTTRLWPGRDPVRMVIDLDGKLPSSLKLFDRSVKTIVFNGIKQEAEKGLLYERISAELPLVPQVMRALHRLQLQSVLVEGGASLLQSFIDAGVWDEARVISNMELEIGDVPGAGIGVSAPVLSHQELVQTEQLQSDRIDLYFPKSN
jgi:diaminohydroxyphosphoribosylaminopyrimidine deaminase/5-amino-6-(5-phosphoribosylamino)uracil reductase